MTDSLQRLGGSTRILKETRICAATLTGWPFFPSGLEYPLLDGFDRLLVQAHTQAAQHADVVSLAVLPDLYGERHNTLQLCLQGFLGVVRLDLSNHPRAGHLAGGTLNP